MTNAEFARYAASIASQAARWARELLDEPNDQARPVSVERFGSDIAGILDRLAARSHQEKDQKHD